jgi:hypothetical protein
MNIPIEEAWDGKNFKRHFKRKEMEHELGHETAKKKSGGSVLKIYHKVPFTSRDHAKKEGMRWDATAKKWYHTDVDVSAKSKFVKENIELDEISSELNDRYTKKAKDQVKELKPWTKKGEYRDLAKNLIKRREVGLAAARRSAIKKRLPDMKEDTDNMSLYMSAIDNDTDFVDVINEKTLTTAELKKREEIALAIEKKNPGMDKSKKMAIATAQAEKTA